MDKEYTFLFKVALQVENKPLPTANDQFISFFKANPSIADAVNNVITSQYQPQSHLELVKILDKCGYYYPPYYYYYTPVPVPVPVAPATATATPAPNANQAATFAQISALFAQLSAQFAQLAAQAGK